jgi:pimeloyl-ACP methyl ester carboxylesterase
MALWQEDAFASHDGKATNLIVVVHGLTGSSAQLGSVAAAAVEAIGESDVYVPMMPYGGLLGGMNSSSPSKIVCALIAAVSALDTEQERKHGESYQRIYLIGYSMGALVARKVALVAHGELAGAPFERGYDRWKVKQVWADRIERIVLLGGISKGWSARSSGNWLTSTIWSMGVFFATLLPARDGMLMETRFGLPFPVQTRLQWLALGRRPNSRMLPIIQLLGSRDNIVSPDDMMDVAVDGVASGSHVLLDMPATGHGDTVKMGDEAGAEVRRGLLQDALTQSIDALSTHPRAISSALLSDGSTPQPEDEVTDVVFVVHGIRDKGFWTAKVAREIKRVAAARPLSDGRVRHVRSMTESYGYLAMLPFVWVGVRRMKAAWLMDRYVDAKARYPSAKFHFVGHSNGTYLAARSLRDYPAAIFERIVFAGSVVRSGFEWEELIDKSHPQVKAVLNYVASNDLVVGIFPAALGWFDLGGAGHTGFHDIHLHPKGSKVPRVFPKVIGQQTSYQVHFSHGGHGSGIVETQWDEIASFIVSGTAPLPQNSDYVGEQTIMARFMGTRPPFGLAVCLILYAVLAVLVGWVSPFALAGFVVLTAILVSRF